MGIAAICQLFKPSHVIGMSKWRLAWQVRVFRQKALSRLGDELAPLMYTQTVDDAQGPGREHIYLSLSSLVTVRVW